MTDRFGATQQEIVSLQKVGTLNAGLLLAWPLAASGIQGKKVHRLTAPWQHAYFAFSEGRDSQKSR